MRKFRKRPVTVEAEQWWPPGHSQHVPIAGVEKGPREDQPYGIATLCGFEVVSPGDWVVKDEMGYVLLFDHHNFSQSFEEVPDPPQMYPRPGSYGVTVTASQEQTTDRKDEAYKASVDLSEFHRLTMQIRMGANVGLIYPPVDATIGRVVMGVSSAQTDQDSTSTRPNEDDAIDIKIEPVEVTYGPFTPKGGTLPTGVEFTPRRRDEDDDGC